MQPYIDCMYALCKKVYNCMISLERMVLYCTISETLMSADMTLKRRGFSEPGMDKRDPGVPDDSIGRVAARPCEP